MAGYQLASETLGDGDWLAVDEGFTQRAVALVAHGFADPDEPMLVRYLEAMPRPTVLVFVDTPIATCSQRLDSRGWPERVADHEESIRHAFLRNAGKAAQFLVERAEAMGVNVARVDGTVAEAVLSSHISSMPIFEDQ